MTWEVFEAERAAEDLERAYAYVASELGSPLAAERLLDRYEEILSLLEKTPLAFPKPRDPMLSMMGYRWLRLRAYLVFYSVDESVGRVYVERILHRRQNWERIIAREADEGSRYELRS